MTTPPEYCTALRSGQRFLLTSHVSPDGDAIGYELGLRRVLVGMGKGAVWNLDAPPAIYRACPTPSTSSTARSPPPASPTFDWLVVLECPSLDRTGLAAQLAALPLINIDHHLGNPHYGEHQLGGRRQRRRSARWCCTSLAPSRSRSTSRPRTSST